ncbi:sugar phosphate isomerase/epimerase family protein [Aquisediminimonas sediminicola]|uniref:sugar phosphate isomerase/epimerase family protein n=1 Tax=Alteraquisediminimonas sediminicola TaxID=2676787 RepID=UPI001C8EC25A|nr:sugar phosphate isomerase/epimerase [Aquisediminimonas sediminicola]
MTISPRLMASYFTIAGNVMPLAGNTVSPHSLEERARAAAEAGYCGIGLVTDDLRALEAKHGFQGIRAIIADAGLDHVEFEVLLDWFADGERRVRADEDRAYLLRAAEQLGAYQIKVGGDITGTSWSIDRMRSSFTELARQAGDAGTMVTIEIFPDSNVRDLPTAISIVEDANPQWGGLLLDVWHMNRGGIPYADFATIPPQYIKHIELDDANAALVGTIMEDTLLRRKLPGEGDFNVPDFLAHVIATGYRGLYGVEILSEELRKLTPAEAARQSYAATMRCFERLSLPVGAA